MTIHKDSKSSIEKFLNRCIVHQNYNISIYVKDMESAEVLLEEILAYYKANGNDGIESTAKDYAIQIFFTTGSVLRIFTKENMISHIHAHLCLWIHEFERLTSEITSIPLLINSIWEMKTSLSIPNLFISNS